MGQSPNYPVIKGLQSPLTVLRLLRAEAKQLAVSRLLKAESAEWACSRPTERAAHHGRPFAERMERVRCQAASMGKGWLRGSPRAGMPIPVVTR